jgi:hypothetical protein
MDAKEKIKKALEKAFRGPHKVVKVYPVRNSSGAF